MTLVEFLEARIAEDEAMARDVRYVWPTDFEVTLNPVRVLAECEVKRRIIECHKSWPVLIETPPEMEIDDTSIDRVVYRMTQRLAWATEDEYRKRFGTEPPTAPVLAALALPYADHPDYRDEWRVA